MTLTKKHTNVGPTSGSCRHLGSDTPIMLTSRQRQADVCPMSGRNGTPTLCRHCSVIGMPTFSLRQADMATACLRLTDVGPTWHADTMPTLLRNRHAYDRPTSGQHGTPTLPRHCPIIGMSTFGLRRADMACRRSKIIGMPTFGLRRADMARRRRADAVK